MVDTKKEISPITAVIVIVLVIALAWGVYAFMQNRSAAPVAGPSVGGPPMPPMPGGPGQPPGAPGAPGPGAPVAPGAPPAAPPAAPSGG
ncbi:MAG: hypothetical protein M1133_03505 [Armatimonadetes bacterium]|nr:hypothetical protein [Armatimonadota bacterium]